VSRAISTMRAGLQDTWRRHEPHPPESAEDEARRERVAIQAEAHGKSGAAAQSTSQARMVAGLLRSASLRPGTTHATIDRESAVPSPVRSHGDRALPQRISSHRP